MAKNTAGIKVWIEIKEVINGEPTKFSFTHLAPWLLTKPVQGLRQQRGDFNLGSLLITEGEHAGKVIRL